jgi:ribosome recycling factor
MPVWPTPLNQIASISAHEARLLVIQPWDPGSLRNIEQAIQKSDLGLNPLNDGRLIRLIYPLSARSVARNLPRLSTNV